MSFWLARRLRDDRWHVLPNSGGGSCLFQAFSQTIDGQLTAQEIRSMVADRTSMLEFTIKQALQPDPRIKTLAQYRQALKEPTRWADGETIQHLEALFDCHLLLVSPSEPGIALHHGGTFEPKRRFFVICNYRDGNHFELVTFCGQRHFDRTSLPPIIGKLFSLYHRPRTL